MKRDYLKLELRDGKLWGGSHEVVASPRGRIDWRLLCAISDELDLSYLYGWDRLRLKVCTICGASFIGHWKAETCSQVCRRVRHETQVRQNNARISEKRKSRRESRDGLRTKCGWCGGPLTATNRRREWCSAKCRQAAWRKWGNHPK